MDTKLQLVIWHERPEENEFLALTAIAENLASGDPSIRYEVEEVLDIQVTVP